MFLAERLFGVSTYSFLLVFVCILIKFTSIECKKILSIYILGLCVMAYYYEPYVTGDLYRIFQNMDWYGKMEFSFFFKNYVVTSSVPISRILFWIIGKTQIHGLLPAFSCFISYSLIFYTIYRMQEKFLIARGNVAITLFFLMATSIYISVIGGIRMMLAMVIIMFCFFRESIERKYGLVHVLLYVIAILMHNMAILILGVRLLASFFSNEGKDGRRIIVWIVIICVVVCAIFESEYFLRDIRDAAKYYLFSDSYSDRWEYMMGVAIAVSYIILLNKFAQLRGKSKYADISTYNIALKICMLISVLFFSIFTVFYRFIGHMVPILGIPIMMVTLQETQPKGTGKYMLSLFQCTILLFGGLLLFIGGTRGSLSSLKFFAM